MRKDVGRADQRAITNKKHAGRRISHQYGGIDGPDVDVRIRPVLGGPEAKYKVRFDYNVRDSLPANRTAEFHKFRDILFFSGWQPYGFANDDFLLVRTPIRAKHTAKVLRIIERFKFAPSAPVLWMTLLGLWNWDKDTEKKAMKVWREALHTGRYDQLVESLWQYVVCEMRKVERIVHLYSIRHKLMRRFH